MYLYSKGSNTWKVEKTPVAKTISESLFLNIVRIQDCYLKDKVGIFHESLLDYIYHRSEVKTIMAGKKVGKETKLM